jgi:hypothetical protein
MLLNFFLHKRLETAPPKLRPAGHIRPAKVFYVARVAVVNKSSFAYYPFSSEYELYFSS